jgi:hypothetical protein
MLVNVFVHRPRTPLQVLDLQVVDVDWWFNSAPTTRVIPATNDQPDDFYAKSPFV